MGVLVQIRDVDEDVRDRLKARALAEGVSLNGLLRNLLAREAAIPSRRDVLARIAERGDLTAASPLASLTSQRRQRDVDTVPR